MGAARAAAAGSPTAPAEAQRSTGAPGSPQGPRSGRAAARPEANERQAETRAWAELLGALLVDNSLYPLHADLLRVGFELPAFVWPEPQADRHQPAVPQEPGDAQATPSTPAPESWSLDGDLAALAERVETCRWGVAHGALRELLRLAVSLLEEANSGELVDLSLLFNYVEQEEERRLLGRCETIGRRSQEGNQLGGPSELARGAARALQRGWRNRGIRLAEAALALSERGPEGRLELENLLLTQRRKGAGLTAGRQLPQGRPGAVGSAVAPAAKTPGETTADGTGSFVLPTAERAPQRPPLPASGTPASVSKQPVPGSPPAAPRPAPRPAPAPRARPAEPVPEPEPGTRSWDDL
jgi:hypothetical protein